MPTIHWTSFSSIIGPIHVASTDRGVCKISIPGTTKKEFLVWLQKRFLPGDIVESPARNREVIAELNRYFDRKLVKFHTHLHPMGTAFQRTVWNELRKVRYGTTISYKDLARRIGHPLAFQAVGRANGANPLPILIPCHRVIGSNDSLCGYGAGVKTKEFLLGLEGAILI
ncbi:MAG: methylated-DNA--[protein]-cysteine S-methyltransferase [Bacteroidota bacterium]